MRARPCFIWLDESPSGFPDGVNNHFGVEVWWGRWGLSRVGGWGGGFGISPLRQTKFPPAHRKHSTPAAMWRPISAQEFLRESFPLPSRPGAQKPREDTGCKLLQMKRKKTQEGIRLLACPKGTGVSGGWWQGCRSGLYGARRSRVCAAQRREGTGALLPEVNVRSRGASAFLPEA